jgi:hypothetical protein
MNTLSGLAKEAEGMAHSNAAVRMTVGFIFIYWLEVSVS